MYKPKCIVVLLAVYKQHIKQLKLTIQIANAGWLYSATERNRGLDWRVLEVEPKLSETKLKYL